MVMNAVPPPPAPSLTPEQIRRGIDRLKLRISDLEAFEPTTVKKRWAPETKALEVSVEETLSRIFGHNTARYRRYQGAAELDRRGISLRRDANPLPKIHQFLSEGKANALALLNEAVRSLEEDLAETQSEPSSAASMETLKAVASDEIFVVHGRDEAAKNEVARCIERAGLTAVILHEQPSAGKTIIEKFEKHGSAAGFAVVIATPDDIGGTTESDRQPRARQNVIGEMFWFAARLGRDRVCALIRGQVEMPSDFAGVGYTPMDDHGGWKRKLLQELDAAGYTQLDWKRALA
jgi:predicted nucleotide-binding protein